MSRPYVLAGLLPQVLAHLPPGAAAAGAIEDGDGGAVPLVLEHVVCGEFRSVRPYYVGYAEREPVVYLTPARFRRLVRSHRAWVVLDGQPRRPRRGAARGAWSICRLGQAIAGSTNTPASGVAP